jgi:TonB-dependent SusC/RagA subfamily outer membrane receptor
MNIKKYVLKPILWLAILGCSSLVYSANDKNLKETKVSIKLKNAELTDIFSVLDSKTDFIFSYGEYVLNKKEKYNAIYENSPLDEILTDLSKAAGFKYEINGSNILIAKENTPTKWSLQQTTIQGTITDELGQPLPGASIVEKGTVNGVSSDFDGNYSISFSDNEAILIISYLGYSTMEVPVNGQNNINAQLQPDAGQLDEVVVIGYGTTTREKFNGAVSKVETEKLNTFSSANFEQALSGNVAGVQVVGNGKNPGENSVIQIRGLNTLTAGTNPLIVVDGNPLSEGSSFSSINNQDIESINILKDAASAAIYGSRASNGVILITTKKGKQGGLKVTYDTYYGFQDRIDNFELVDAYDAALFDSDARNFGYVSGGPGRSLTDDNATRDANLICRAIWTGSSD